MGNSTDSKSAFPSERISVLTTLNPQEFCVDVVVSGTDWLVHMDASSAQYQAEKLLETIAAHTNTEQDARYICHFGEYVVPMTREACIDFATLLLKSGASAQFENHQLAFLQERMDLEPLEALHMARAYREFAARLSEQEYQHNPDNYE